MAVRQGVNNLISVPPLERPERERNARKRPGPVVDKVAPTRSLIGIALAG